MCIMVGQRTCGCTCAFGLADSGRRPAVCHKPSGVISVQVACLYKRLSDLGCGQKSVPSTDEDHYKADKQ